MLSKEENILLAAEEIFAKKGFSATSTREISAAANVNISMISYYFGSKEKLYEKIFEYRMNEGIDFAAMLSERNDLQAWQKLELLIDRFMYRLQNMKNFYTIFQREQLNLNNPLIVDIIKKFKSGFINQYSKIYEDGRTAGVFTKKPKMEFLHASVSGTLFTAVNSFPLYQEIFGETADYEKNYHNQLKTHVMELLKNLLGYENN